MMKKKESVLVLKMIIVKYVQENVFGKTIKIDLINQKIILMKKKKNIMTVKIVQMLKVNYYLEQKRN